MAAVYEIRDSAGSLVIRAKRKRGWTRSFFGAAITGIAAVLTLSHIVTGSILAVVVFLAVLLGLSEGFGQARAELGVTPLEFQTRGNLGTDFLPVHTICSADIRWLEYQPESGGPDVGYRPGGLFAKVRVGTVCVLPLLDEEQTNKVIERITKRFPEMAKHWHAPSIGDSFTTLGLGQK